MTSDTSERTGFDFGSEGVGDMRSSQCELAFSPQEWRFSDLTDEELVDQILAKYAFLTGEASEATQAADPGEISPAGAAILVVHMQGACGDLGAILDIARIARARPAKCRRMPPCRSLVREM